jgi:hypothetical protein
VGAYAEQETLTGDQEVINARERLSRIKDVVKEIYNFPQFNRPYVISNENPEMLSLLISSKLKVDNPVGVFVLGGTAIPLSKMLDANEARSWFVDFYKPRIEIELLQCNLPDDRIFHAEIFHFLSCMDKPESNNIDLIYLSNTLDWLYWYWSYSKLEPQVVIENLVQVVQDIKILFPKALLTITSCELSLKRNIIDALQDKYQIFQDFNSTRQSESKKGLKKAELVVMIK